MPLKYLQSAQQSFDAVRCAASATYKMYKYTPTHAVYEHMHGKDNKRGEHMSRIECILLSVHFLASIQSFVVRSRSVCFFFHFFGRFNFHHTHFISFIRIQNFRLHHNDSHMNQCFEVHRINRMFNNSNARSSSSGGDKNSGGISKLDQSKLNNNDRLIEGNCRDAADENGVTDGGVEIPNENNKALLDKNSNRELFTMDSLNRNSLSGTWWVVCSDDTQSYF